MTGKYQQYPEYADSGVTFFDSVPQHWKTKKVNYLFTFGRGLNITKANLEDAGIPCVSYGEVHSKYGFEVNPSRHALKCVSDNYLNVSPRSLLSSGDFVFADTSEDLDGAGNFTQFVGEGLLFAGYHTVILKEKEGHDSRYLAYAFDSAECRNQIRLAVKGVKVFSITQEILKNVSVLLPSPEEQRTIAAFLDYETARIDKLIEKQQRLIELLKEKRQAVISHAVTKGLNPNAPMKDSGIEWLGEVPEHWVVSKFGFISLVVRGGSPRPAGDPELFDGDYSPWVTVAEITKDDEVYLTETESFLTKKGSQQCRVFSSGTLLLSNSGATLGVPKILSIDANANDGVVGFEQLKIDSEFAYFYLSTLTEDLRDRIKQGSGQPNLNTDIVKAISVPVPPSDEIQAIVAEIHRQRTKFSKLMEKAKQGVSLLNERRTALISAAVTGKIDLRGWPAPTQDSTSE